jgi:serine/threonine-protein kinase
LRSDLKRLTLAAALAAGETPSPELVAEAGASGGLKPSVAVVCLAACLIAVGLLVGLSGKRSLARRVTLDTLPEVLAAKAREVIHDAGYEDPPVDNVYTFYENGSYMRHLMDLEPAPGRWDVLHNGQPSAVRFGYRQSPRPLTRRGGYLGNWLDDPPPTFPGMVEVRLDTEGRLLSFSAVPPRKVDPGEAPAGEPDWAPLFAAAGFDRQAFTPVDPVWLSPVYADRRAAWEGVYPEAPDTSIRVEAAAYRNRPVAFRVIEPWTRAVGTAAAERGFWIQARDVLYTVLFVMTLVGAGLVALRNIRLGRGDRRTALRFALYLGGVRMLWLLGAHHIASSAEIFLFRQHLAWALYRVGLVYVFYVAFEPYVRKLWPQVLASWVRLLGGRFRDPLVGRDLLIGALYGTGSAVIGSVMVWIPEVLGLQGYGFEADIWSWESLRGLREAVAAVAGVHARSVLEVFLAIMLFLVLRLLLRRTWIAVVVLSALATLVSHPGTGHPAPYLIGFLIVILLLWFVLFRFGLLPVSRRGTAT